MYKRQGGQSSEKPAENGASGQTTQASAGKEDGAGSEGGKVMTYAMQKEPETLDPTMNNYATSSIVLQNLFTGLMQIGPDGGLINGCAEKYEVSEDGLEYTFTPVSYTHLDVYKRQAQITAAIIVTAILCPIFVSYLHKVEVRKRGR